MNWYHIHTGHFGYPQPEEDTKLLLTFDYGSGCPTCKVGKVQYAPVRFRNEPKVRNKAFTGLNWMFGEAFLTDAARDILEKEGISGLSFSRPVIHKSGKPLENWFQMHPTTVLPPAILTDRLTTERCEYPRSKRDLRFLKAVGSQLLDGPFCGRIKFNPKSVYELDATVMEGQPDVVCANEWMGSGGSARREIFASQRFKDVCEKYSLRGLFFHQAILMERPHGVARLTRAAGTIVRRLGPRA